MVYLNIYRRLVLLTLLMVLGSLQLAHAQQSEANILAVMEERQDNIKMHLPSSGEASEDQKSQLRLAVNDMFDFGAMGRAALGRHWADLNQDQQVNFVQVFSDIVRHQSLADLDVYRAAVTYDDIAVTGESARVTTTTTYKDVPTKVEYLLVYSQEKWLATDVILDGVGTVEGYSRSFQSVIRKRGFDSLMNSLNKRLARTRGG